MAVTDFFAGEIATELVKQLFLISARALKYKSIADKLIDLIENIQPTIKEIQYSGVELPPHRQAQIGMLSNTLKKGKDLTDEVLSSRRWNMCRQFTLARKMEKLEKAISDFLKNQIFGASHPTPPNQSPIQPEHHSSPSPPSQSPRRPPPSGQNLLSSQVTVTVTPSPDHPIQPEQQHNPIPLFQSRGQSNSIPGYQRASQSAPSQRTATPSFPMIQLVVQSPNHSLPPPSPPIRIPWYRGNEFMAMEPAPHGPLPHEFHTMDNLSLCVLNYFVTGGLGYTATWSQRPNLSTSIHIQCFLNQAAFSLFLLANAVFPRTRPALAFVLDRLSFLLIVISAYLASMPMSPPYVAIIMFLVVVIVYLFARFRG